MLIPTLSIRQPYCWAICHAKKDVENRDWSTRYRGPILIHASKSGTHREFEGSRQQIVEVFGVDVPALEELPRGGLVARAILADVVGAERYCGRCVSPWYAGPPAFAWLLEAVEELRTADGAPAVLPLAGRQGLFEVDWRDFRPRMQAEGLRWERVT